LGHVTMLEPSLIKEADSRAVRHVAALGHMPCPLSVQSLYVGYPVCKVPTVKKI
jgi:hypothetical protein